MKKLRVAINGFGRIGRCVAKVLLEEYANTAEIIAVNDLTDAKTLAHLFTYDSFFGVYPQKMSAENANTLQIGEYTIAMLSEADPSKLPWNEYEIDVVLECTGRFTDTPSSMAHITAGARKVILSASAKDDTPMFILGVNEQDYSPEMNIVSNASCTTNCLAPIVHVLHEEFGVERGLMNTVHSYTQDQRLQDAPHKDLRRARNAQMSIVPTTTGAATSVGKIIPSLQGKIDGFSLRVPTPDVSIVDFTCTLSKHVNSIDEVHSALQRYIDHGHSHIMKLSSEPLVSIDFKRDSHSCIIDTPSTMLLEGNMLKILAWYDNEWGYASRLADLAIYTAKR